MKIENKAVVLFSGGLDSTTALYWALKNFTQTFAMTINYNQRHAVEVDMAQRIARKLGVEIQVVQFPLKDIVYSALIDHDKEIPDSLASAKINGNVPVTYVPFRNGIFLALATAYAESRGIFNLVTGFNLVDTPDYPDTTADFTTKMENAINSGTSAAFTHKKFTIHTPLINKSKQQIITWGLQLGADYSYSISCYRGQEQPCLHCPSCDIRNHAFNQLGMEDPLITRLKKEKYQ